MNFIVCEAMRLLHAAIHRLELVDGIEQWSATMLSAAVSEAARFYLLQTFQRCFFGSHCCMISIFLSVAAALQFELSSMEWCNIRCARYSCTTFAMQRF